MFRWTEHGKRLLRFMLIGTIPAGTAGLLLRDWFDQLNEQPRWVAVAMIAMGGIMIATRFLEPGRRRAGEVRIRDAVVMGVGQAFALIPGVSRSGATITSGMVEGFEPRDSANLAFLLGIPAIAGAGIIEFTSLASEEGGIASETWLGLAVAAVSGYAAIALLLRLIRRAGLFPFGLYCVAAGVAAFVLV